ncbi:hypothetical protein H4219_002451 [Mycoemilia scoparia]|uniref:Uncharacterized protein n=1 Tax=Mycoemilia scoparia TaxID=417184 RepID=A0A9W8A6Z8_9FUNG|nr:hypothetical protein H4219_002451 [Mycoemilia scoparia]
MFKQGSKWRCLILLVLPSLVYCQGGDTSDTSKLKASQCSDHVQIRWNLNEHIGSIFVILACGGIGAFLPLAGQRYSKWKTPDIVLGIAKFFGIGVIITTGLIHMLPAAQNSLTDPCLGAFSMAYGSWASAFALMSIFVLHGIEYLVSSIALWYPLNHMDKVYSNSDAEDPKLSVTEETDPNVEKSSNTVYSEAPEERRPSQPFPAAPPTPTSTLHELPTTSTYVDHGGRQPNNGWSRAMSRTSFCSNGHSLVSRHSISNSHFIRSSPMTSKARLRLSAMTYQSGTLLQSPYAMSSVPGSAGMGAYEGATLLSYPRQRSLSAVASSTMSLCPCCVQGPSADNPYLYYNYDQHMPPIPAATTSRSPKQSRRTPSRISRVSYVSHLSRIASLYRHYRLPTISQGSCVYAKPSTDAVSVFGNQHRRAPSVWCTPLLIEPRNNSDWYYHANSYQEPAVGPPDDRSIAQATAQPPLSMRSPKVLAWRQTTVTYLLEAGISIHSVLIGVTIGVATGSQFTSLLIAMSFHQTFEGLALGARLVELCELKKKKARTNNLYVSCTDSTASTTTFSGQNHVESSQRERQESSTSHPEEVSLQSHEHHISKISLFSAIFYAFTTPIGIIIGMGIHASYISRSPSALLTQGILDSLSAGILLYTGLTTLLAHEFETPSFQSSSRITRLILFISMYVGAILMGIVGIWS